MKLPKDFLSRLEIKARYAIGFDGIWSVMLDLDREGPWTAGDVCAMTTGNPGTPRDFIRMLKKAGFVAVVGERAAGAARAKQKAPLYRLTQRPLDPPRVQRDGRVLPEPLIETIWRSIKMAKQFTADELVAVMSKPGEPAASRNTVISYCDRLASVKVLTKVAKRGQASRYRLAKNLGAKAPKVLGTKVVFDPNAGVVMGEAELSEVAP
ncbi:MAG: hypothetical protein M9955_13285 [Rhizobiaceae bacterium]|nr:hypothetical protein [Rhizobiaceae bacterium]